MATYYDDWEYHTEPQSYGEPQYYEDTPYNYEEPQYYEDVPNSYEEPQYYEDMPYCHVGLELADDEPRYEEGPTYDDMIPCLPCYEDLHPIYQDCDEGFRDCVVEEDQEDEEHGSNKSVEYPPHHPNLNNVANNTISPVWVDPDPNYELSLEEWEVLVAEQNAADDAILAKLEQELEETLALYNPMDPLEQDELNNRIDLLDEDVDDTRSLYQKFMDTFNLMAAEKHSSSPSLDTMVPPPPQLECSPRSLNHINPTVPRPPQKTHPQQHIFSVTVAPKHHTHFRARNRPMQHRHPPHNKLLPSQPYPTSRQHQHLDSQTKPHRKHPPNRNLLIKTTLDIGSNARHRISQKAVCISQH